MIVDSDFQACGEIGIDGEFEFHAVLIEEKIVLIRKYQSKDFKELANPFYNIILSLQ